MDGLKDREKIQFVTEPGTGTHGTAYLDQVWEITYDSGEQTKEITLSTLAFTGQEDLDFYLCANREDGRQSRLKIVVKPSSE
ncbi:glycosyl hydrolase family 29 (alpha-L-fucosidase) [Streptococcus gordonii]|uniref:Glycosyl hydrolase family 29 (Alpha-L-fucosidase) n=1 Tax=Streptococcus gordonii TaxID=1302 RepID=A0A139MXA0_STRGN|nr:glycosyl hydrolase family 29 (alpha-L-fucosidase) [Streptococcus gordonii]